MIDDRYRRRDEHEHDRDRDEFHDPRHGASADEPSRTRDWEDRDARFGRGYDQHRGGSAGRGLYGVHGPEEYRDQPRGGYGRDRSPGFDPSYGDADRFAGGSADYGRDLERQAYGPNPRAAYSRPGAAIGGEHRGRGPRGYQRSDERIREDVSDRLSDDGMVDASDIEVSVRGGEVTLSGTVSSRDQKRRAEDIAEAVSAVTNVQNNLRVGQGTNASAASRGTDMSGVSASASGASAGTSAGQGNGNGPQVSRKT